MVRFLIAVMFLALAAAPAFACPRGEFNAYDLRAKGEALQSGEAPAASPPAVPTGKKPS